MTPRLFSKAGLPTVGQPEDASSMEDSNTIAIIVTVVTGLIVARLGVELWLATLNRRHARAHAAQIPDALREVFDAPAYQKSIAYALAKERFGGVESVYDTLILLAVLFSGILPWTFHWISARLGQSAWAMAVFLFAVGVALSLLSLPLAWISQFRLEERFGFNTTTPRIWWSDRFKSLLLSLVLLYPLLVLLLKMIAWTGAWWWLWDWAVVVAFQLLLGVLGPVLILPLFNRLSPLPAGSLRERLLALADRTRFQVKNIQVMDGSKRSRHSNAFFTGLGRLRKIVLFDTLVEQLSEPELEAVVAHEIGHFKERHVPKLLVTSAVALLIGFYLIALLARQNWFYHAFGFAPGHLAPALLLFGLLAGPVSFWVGPIMHWWSRRNEYEADAFAVRAMAQTQPLLGALRKLNAKNLSYPVPHPVYSAFYYSHPTLLEREHAMTEVASELARNNLSA